MKLINLDYAIQKAEQTDIFDYCDILGFISNLPEIDPIHAAGGCYCKECIYKEESTIKNPKYYWCQLRNSYMDLDGFCSEGRKDENQ